MAKWNRNKSKRRRWERNALINKYGAVCFYCELPFAKMRDITLDHYVPISKGGLDELANYRLAHFRCNSLKSGMTPEEFEVYQKGGDLVE